jgi:hypothetical protein
MDMQSPAERHLMLDASGLLLASLPRPVAGLSGQRIFWQKTIGCNVIILMKTINDAYTHVLPLPANSVYRKRQTMRGSV